VKVDRYILSRRSTVKVDRYIHWAMIVAA